MFETFSYEFLQHYWWLIVSVLAGLLVFLMFVQGGQTLLFTIAKDETERTMLVNSLGRKWEFTFTTLVTFGGAFFASFPLFYSSSFGGAYWVWIVILFSFILQAVSYEYRKKPNNLLGSKTFEVFLFINGLIGTFVIGVAVATFFTGSGFHITDLKSVRWDSDLRGLEALGNVWNISLGLAIFFLARTLALLYFLNNIQDDNIIKRSKKHLIFNGLPFVVFFLTFLISTLFAEGFAVDPETQLVFMEKYKYLNNFIEMPLVAVIFVLGVLMTLWGIIRTIVFTKKHEKGIWWSGIGVVLVVVMLLLNVGYNHTSFYPSYSDLQSSLTIYNSSSSQYTLTIMSYVSLLVPFVFAYIWYAWKAINNKKIDRDEVNQTDEHVY